ncbi:protein kinase [Candidatus Woesearchaeota archaeon]|nr:protein kinase [Candidatus Woesearchaeota archaeon]
MSGIIGMTVNGFRLDKKLGESIMADTFLASAEGVPGQKVVKVAKQGLEQVLAHEIDILRKLAPSGRVVTVETSGLTDDRRPYFVMPYIGPNLFEWAKRVHANRAVYDQYLFTRMSDDSALRPSELTALDLFPMTLGIIEACSECYEDFKVHHGDLKPENILIEERTNSPRLADFGLAHRTREYYAYNYAYIDRLGENGVRNVQDYVAPELWKAGSQPTVASDVFSLGVVLFEMLTGHIPIGRYRPVNEQNLVGFVPASVVSILDRMISREPKERHQGYTSLIADLRSSFTTMMVALSQPVPLQEVLSFYPIPVGATLGDDIVRCVHEIGDYLVRNGIAPKAEANRKASGGRDWDDTSWLSRGPLNPDLWKLRDAVEYDIMSHGGSYDDVLAYRRTGRRAVESSRKRHAEFEQLGMAYEMLKATIDTAPSKRSGAFGTITLEHIDAVVRMYERFEKLAGRPSLEDVEERKAIIDLAKREFAGLMQTERHVLDAGIKATVRQIERLYHPGDKRILDAYEEQVAIPSYRISFLWGRYPFVRESDEGGIRKKRCTLAETINKTAWYFSEKPWKKA